MKFFRINPEAEPLARRRAKFHWKSPNDVIFWILTNVRMCGNSWAHGNSNWAPCLSTKNRQNPDKFIRLPILALLYSLQNCTGLFFANKKNKNSNSRRTPSSTCQYHENAESSIKILYKCKKYFFYFLPYFVISSVRVSPKIFWLSKTFHPKHHPTSNFHFFSLHTIVFGSTIFS